MLQIKRMRVGQIGTNCYLLEDTDAKICAVVAPGDPPDAIAQAIREAQKAKEEGKEKTILFNLSGHGMIDLYAYEQYFAGNLQNYTIPDSEITCSLKDLEKII